jgi:G3E family GTPase
MRTPVVLVCGQGDADGVVDVLAQMPGTVVVRHRFDGQVVVRTVSTPQGPSEWPLEVANGCVACTVRNALLVLLRRLHRRCDVSRIVVHLLPWLEPEPVCWAIKNVRVRVGPGFIDGPAARDVRIDAVIACIDSSRWLGLALGDDGLDDGRTAAQVVVGQPSLDPDGDVGLLLFSARRPFHPQRLHAALDLLLDGVVRARGRLWLANRFDDVMWIESAGGGLRSSYAGRWLASMDSSELAYADPHRRALAAADWDGRLGDRHASITVLVCGAEPQDIVDGLRGALLTDDELARPNEWARYADPFGDWHEDPCDDSSERAVDTAGPNTGEEGRT